jgi:hypothetical protein
MSSAVYCALYAGARQKYASRSCLLQISAKNPVFDYPEFK